MRVIPVIDLMDGQVVRGVGGRRHEYRPIQSVLAQDAKPVTVARAFAGLGLTETYVADLDAIGGSEPAWRNYDELAASGLRLWIDAGLADVARARDFDRFIAGERPLAGIIAGLESLVSIEFLSAIVDVIGPERLIFSLDLKHGVPLVRAAEFHGKDARQIAEMALGAGVRRMIVLDLACVGEGQGVGTLDLCRWLRQREAGLELIAGGGVRNFEDLLTLREAGCDAALVASALHDGRLEVGRFAELRRD